MPKIHDVEVDEYLSSSVQIEPTTIEEEYIRMPADMAYWGHRYAEAHKEFLKAKMQHDRVLARLRLEMRETLAAEGKKPTESMVDSHVELTKTWLDSKTAEIDAEANREHLRCTLDAIRTKREMLVSLGATVRAEMQANSIIRDQMRGTRVRGED